MSISMPYKTVISTPYGNLKGIVAWCERNCEGEYLFAEDTNSELVSSFRRVDDKLFNNWLFFFESERDYVAFTLFNK